ncbi:MAG: hypothetical protein QM779_02105 [Propionicimonas sp.]|uniref:hypothetical protein n=1 Tax=Propionicimonas sp. TaxID=1955623 RepID=UPI003D134D10
MARVLPPPAERFDPITARWLTPGGPLQDPQRDDIDPGHSEPVTLVGPVPRELADAAVPRGDAPDGHHTTRRRWLVLAFFAFAVVALLLGTFPAF